MTFRPKPLDVEILLDDKKVIMSKTDKRGIIQYVNDYFCEVAQYDKEELIGKPHNIIRHPDMPKVIFKLLWEKLHKAENLYVIIKNLTKYGNYYWVVTKFETTFDDNGNILAHYARRKAIPKKIKNIAGDIYDKIRKIEAFDEQLAEDSFYEILASYNLTYDQFFLELTGMTQKEVDDYFLSKEYNTNIKSEDIVVDIENAVIEKEGNIDESFILNNIENLKKQVSDLKQKIQDKEKQDGSGFLGGVAKDLKKEMENLKHKK